MLQCPERILYCCRINAPADPSVLCSFSYLLKPGINAAVCDRDPELLDGRQPLRSFVCSLVTENIRAVGYAMPQCCIVLLKFAAQCCAAAVAQCLEYPGFELPDTLARNVE